MKENRLLFTNALIVLPTETINGSLAVEDGKITGIFESGTELPGFTEVDVHGKALMPGAIDALTDGELTLRKGEVLGLIGENGAGKSTLMKILSGVYQADAGVMIMRRKAH